MDGIDINRILIHKGSPDHLSSEAKTLFAKKLFKQVNVLVEREEWRSEGDRKVAKGHLKIAGTGAATIGDYVILVGNLIADFNYNTMVRVLKVPDEKFRGKVFQSMRENLTTLKRELGQMPTWDEMAEPLLKRFEAAQR